MKIVFDDCLLVEIDCLFFVLVLKWGKCNEFVYVKYVVEKVVELRGVILDSLVG